MLMELVPWVSSKTLLKSGSAACIKKIIVGLPGGLASPGSNIVTAVALVTAMTQVQYLAWETPQASDVAKKKKKKDINSENTLKFCYLQVVTLGNPLKFSGPLFSPLKTELNESIRDLFRCIGAHHGNDSSPEGKCHLLMAKTQTHAKAPKINSLKFS